MGSRQPATQNAKQEVRIENIKKEKTEKKKSRFWMMTDDDTADVTVDRVSRIAVVLPVWKLRRCTLECVPWTSTQAVKQQKGQGNCAGRADG